MDRPVRSGSNGLALIALFIACSIWPANAAAEMLSVICNNQVVSVGDREGMVLAKCGQPLSKSSGKAAADERRTSTRKKTAPTKLSQGKSKKTVKKTQQAGAVIWTYNMGGSYRFLIFEEGKLTGIEAGGLAD